MRAPARHPRRLRLGAALAALAAAAALAARAAGDDAAAGPRAFGPPWESALLRDHPLAGRAWDLAGHRFVDEAALARAALAADLVLLGEMHDNPDHHRLQARILRALVDAGRRPAVAFEMLDPDRQAAIDAARARAPRDPDALAAAAGWAKSGWPPFATYRPIFTVALDADLPIVAANLPRPQARAFAERGAEVLAPGARRLLERAGPLSPAAERALRKEMAEDHCGALPEDALPKLVAIQRARDATLAAGLAGASVGRGGVLITGAGHAREDRGVPSYVAREEPAPKVLAIAFVEVEAGATDPARYDLPYDYAVFTPRAAREDPCAAFRHAGPAR